MAEERRKSVRIKKVIIVRYRYAADNNDKKWDMTSVRDISETGMCITTHRQFSPNDILLFLIKIPSKPLEWVDFRGRVIASEKLMSVDSNLVSVLFITRVEFLDIEVSQRELIREYINWVLAKEGGAQK